MYYVFGIGMMIALNSGYIEGVRGRRTEEKIWI
jgi:hypothetical protein